MNKMSLKFIGTILFLILGYSSFANAQEITEKTVDGGVYRSWELKAGMKIALRGAMSTNGNQWFSSTDENFKVSEFDASCIFEIENANTNGKFVLKSNGQYLEKATLAENTNDTPVKFTSEKANAAEFTFSCPNINDETKQFPNDGFSYNDNMYVRFTTTYNESETYLNTNATEKKPKFHNGTAGYSVWLVYSVGDHSNSYQAKKKRTKQFGLPR